MMRFKCNATVGVCPVEFLVDAETATDATTIGRAYLITCGMGHHIWGGVAFVDTAPPLGARPGVVKSAPAARAEARAEAQAHTFKMLYGAPPCADFASLEARVLARMADEGVDFHSLRAERDGISREEAKRRNFYDLYHGEALAKPSTLVAGTIAKAMDEGTVASFKDGRGWINLYMREDGSVHAGGVYTSKAGAESIATRNGNGYRSSQALMTWDASKGVPDKGKLYPDGNGGWKKADGQPCAIKPALGLRDMAMEVAQKAYDLAERAAEPLPVQYASWSGLTHGEQRHFKNRLVSWAGLQSAAGGKGCTLSVNDYGHDGSKDYITMSVSSPRWENCLARLREWLMEIGVPFAKPSYSTLRVKWTDIAPLLTPL